MTVRSAPPPQRPIHRRAVWLRVGGLALVLLIVVGIALSLLSGGLGTPDEARRSFHPAGFSICVPIGWDATVYQRPSRGTDTLRLVPERSTGRQTILQATRLAGPPKLAKTAVETTFQGQRAYREVATTHYDWIWQVSFDRNGAWYHVQITSPIELDQTNDPLIAFANTFRTETPTDFSTTQPTTTQPATSLP